MPHRPRMLTIRTAIGGTVHLDPAHVLAVLMPPHAVPGTVCIVVLSGVQIQVDFVDATRIVEAIGHVGS